jgi:hypothetical protein
VALLPPLQQQLMDFIILAADFIAVRSMLTYRLDIAADAD